MFFFFVQVKDALRKFCLRVCVKWYLNFKNSKFYIWQITCWLFFVVLQFLHRGLSVYLHQNRYSLTAAGAFVWKILFLVKYRPLVSDSGLAGRQVARAQLMRSCLAAVKASVLVLQRAQDTISTTLQVEPSSCKLEEILSNLLSCYTHILTDGDYRHTSCFVVLIILQQIIWTGAAIDCLCSISVVSWEVFVNC